MTRKSGKIHEVLFESFTATQISYFEQTIVSKHALGRVRPSNLFVGFSETKHSGQNS